MPIPRGSTVQYSEHLRQVEEILDQIRYDRSIDDAERRHQINEALASANARALSLRAARPQPLATAPLVAHEHRAERWLRRLAPTG